MRLLRRRHLLPLLLLQVLLPRGRPHGALVLPLALGHPICLCRLLLATRQLRLVLLLLLPLQRLLLLLLLLELLLLLLLQRGLQTRYHSLRAAFQAYLATCRKYAHIWFKRQLN